MSKTRDEQIMQFIANFGREPTKEEKGCFNLIRSIITEHIKDFDLLALHERDELLYEIGPRTVEKAVRTYRPRTTEEMKAINLEAWLKNEITQEEYDERSNRGNRPQGGEGMG